MVISYNLFLICILYSLYKEYYVYSLSFFLLFITSYLIYTRPYNTYIYYVDRLSICIIVYIGFLYYLDSRSYSFIPVLCLILTIFVYYSNIIDYPLKNEIVHFLTVIGHLSIISKL